MTDRTYYSREAEERAKRQRALTAGLFLLVGAGIGAILALLYAPNEGEEVRGEITDRVGSQMDNGREAAQHAVKQMEAKYNDLRKYVEDALSNIKMPN